MTNSLRVHEGDVLCSRYFAVKILISQVLQGVLSLKEIVLTEKHQINHKNVYLFRKKNII